MLRLRGALGLLALVLGAIVVAPSAQAQTVPPPSLAPSEQLLAGADTGEGGVFTANFDCVANKNGDVTIGFSATGVAVGPYPGMFMEGGSVAFHPDPTTGMGPVTVLDTTFTIAAFDGTLVTGKKTLLVSPVADNTAFCTSVAGGQSSDEVFFTTPVSYEATIKLPDGSMFSDSGTGSVTGHSAQVPPVGGLFFMQEANAELFQESFDTSNGVVPLANSGHVTGGGWILGPTITNRVSFGFEAKANPNGLHATCTVIDHATKSQIKCQTIDSLVVVGTHAYFTGLATMNGTLTRYRIDVDDLGEPGTLDTFKIQLLDTVPPYTAGGILLGGNIQIHKQ